MGIFRQMKDMKDMLDAAPGMVAQARQMGEQAQQMGAQAHQMAAAQQAAMQAQMAQGMAGPGMAGQAAPAGPDFEPVAGVPLEEFAAVSKGVAAYNYDPSKLVEIAAARGIPAHLWAAAHQGWNDRIRANPAVARRFNQLYRES